MWEEEFWSDGDSWNWTWTWTLAVLFVILTYRLLASVFLFRFGGESEKKAQLSCSSPVPPLINPGIVSDLDLKILIESLDENFPANADVIWENVIDKSTGSLAYRAKYCKPKDGGPLKYLSVTTFEDCSVEVLLNFYMDNHYRTQWDKTVVQHKQLQMDKNSGTEIGRTEKKFPFLTPREYVLAWRLWQGKDGSYYCFSKECDHDLAPRNPKRCIRAKVFRSGWKITKVPGRNASEIRMVHQEDAGLNVEMAKLAFSKGIWSYVCKMNDALHRYSVVKKHQLNSTVSAITYIQKVPPEFEVRNDMISSVHPVNTTVSTAPQVGTRKSNMRKLSRSSSSKLVANGLILVGGAICLSKGHSSLGAKIAMAYILSKLTKRGGASSKQAS